MKNITIYDVAKKAGKSRQVASSILNNKGYIKTSNATREKVLQAARELNYRPNFFSRSLKAGRTNCIGLMGSLRMINFTIPYFNLMADRIETELDRANSDYSLVVFGANYSESSRKSLQLIQRGMVDGLIIILLSQDVAPFENEVWPVLTKANLPFVVVHSLSRGLAYNNVGLDSRHGGHLAGNHFARLGHPDVHYYGSTGEHGSPQVAEIFTGFKQALVENGIAWDNARIIAPQRSADWLSPYDMAYHTFRELKTVPPAVFCPPDESAFGALAALKERNIRVPQDVSLIGFNDYEPMQKFHAPLTTIHHPLEEKGALAVRIVTEILNGKRDRNQVYSTILKPTLVERSTCKVRSAKCEVRTEEKNE
jgi:LacI family transcriptional regulator